MGKPQVGPFFIVFEGIDGTGKNTQVKLLKKYLNRTYPKIFAVKTTAEPTRTKFGNFLREQMKTKSRTQAEELSLLFATDRAFHVINTIIPQIRKKNIVISERYVYSSLVYQGYYLPIRWLIELNALAIVPDLVFVIDLSPDIAQKRIRKRFEQSKNNVLKDKREFFEKEYWFLQRINEMFKDICNKELELPPTRTFNKDIRFDDPTFVILDGDKSPGEIHQQVIPHVESLLQGEHIRITERYDFDAFYNSKSQTSIMDFLGKVSNNHNKSINSSLEEFRKK